MANDKNQPSEQQREERLRESFRKKQLEQGEKAIKDKEKKQPPDTGRPEMRRQPNDD